MIKNLDIFEAIKKNNIALVKEFLEQGIDPNCYKDHAKLTPLHYAVVWERTNIIPLLLNAGADVNFADIDGETPLKVAHSINYKKAIEIFAQFNNVAEQPM